MNDYQKMRRFLEGSSQDEFIGFLDKLGFDILVDEEERKIYETLDDGGGSRRLPWHGWREQRINELLESRNKSPSEWDRICWAANIDSDSAEQMRLARRANRTATLALILSCIGILWHIGHAVLSKKEDQPRDPAGQTTPNVNDKKTSDVIDHEDGGTDDLSLRSPS